MTLRVVDLSRWNTITDWDALCRFADVLIFKCTEGSPEGVAFADPLFGGRLAEARRRGKLIGAYHYVGSSVARRVYSPASEADWFAAHYGWQPGEVPIYDYEPANPPADPDGWLATAIARLAGRGWPVAMTYMNTTSAAARSWPQTRTTGTGLWLARYFANDGRVPTQQPSPGAFGAYAMWQYTSNGAVPGVAGPADVSEFYGTADQWRAYGGAGAAPTPPPTQQGEPDMRLIRTPDGAIWKVTDTEVIAEPSAANAAALAKIWGPWVDVAFAEKDAQYMDADARAKRQMRGVQDYILGQDPGADPEQWLFPRIVATEGKVDALAAQVANVQNGGVNAQQVADLVIGQIRAAFIAQQTTATAS